MVTGSVLQETLAQRADREAALPSVGCWTRLRSSERKKKAIAVFLGKKRGRCARNLKQRGLVGLNKKFTELFHTSITETTVIAVSTFLVLYLQQQGCQPS